MADNDNDLEFVEVKKKKKGGFCKTILRFFGSNVGLFIALSFYIVGGAYAFIYLESDLEELEKAKKQNLEQLLNDSETFMVNYFTSLHYDKAQRLDNCSQAFKSSKEWTDYHSFSSSACPPSRFNTEFCSCLRMVRARYQEEVSSNMYQLANLLVQMSKEHGFDGTFGTFNYKWTPPNAILFTMTTLTMIGYGNIAPRTSSGQMFCMVYTVFGLALMMLFLANIGNMMARTIKRSYSRLACRWCRVRRRWSQHPEGLNTEPDRIKDDIVGPEDYMPTNDIAIPVSVTVIIMGLYIFGGAAVFCKWEEEWDIVTSVYFTWVTLTTIGFGDYTPGSSFHGDLTIEQVMKMTFTTFYCLAGLAIISMGISLSSEQIKNDAVWLSYALGFKEDEEAVRRRLTRTRCTGVRETPKNKTGNKHDFFSIKRRGRGEVEVNDIE